MIEKVEIKQLNFVNVKEKESKVKYCSLKEVYDKIFPFFSEIYNLSKAFDTRSKLAEDENYINTRIEIGEILLNLRNSHKLNDFSDSDYKFINELLNEWCELTKNFPVFGGDVSRLYLFWFLSFIDILENIFYSEVKIISFVDLFFFEKILDYILSERGEEQAEKEELFRVFERFKPPMDHYRALNLILSHLKIKNDEIKNKLFEFYDSLIPKLKNKVNYINLLLTKANHLLKQEKYKVAFELLEKNKNFILKEKPIEWISKIVQIKREDCETGEKIDKLFEDENFIEKIVKIAPEEDKYEFSLMLLYELEIENKPTEKFLNEILDEREKEVFSSGKYNLLLRRAWGYLKKKDFVKAENFIKSYDKALEEFLPFDYLNFKISFYKSSGRVKEFDKILNNIKYLKSFVEKVKTRELKKKISLLILKEVKIKDSELKDFFYNLIKPEELIFSKNKGIISLYIYAFIKQKEYEKVRDGIFYLVKNYKIFPPREFLDILFFIYWEVGIDKNLYNNIFDDRIVYFLIKSLETVPPEDFRRFLFVWEIIKEKGLRDEYIREFLDVLMKKDANGFEFFIKERKLLIEYVNKRRMSVVSGKEIDISVLKKILFSEFAGDVLEKDVRSKVLRKIGNVPITLLFSEIELILMRSPGDEVIFNLLNSQ